MSKKLTYEELEKRNRELENRLRTTSSDGNPNHCQKILDCSPSVIYTKDLEGRYTSINKQFETLSRLKSEDVLGKTDIELFPPQVAKNSTKNDKQVIQTGTPKEIEEYGPVNGQMHSFISMKYPLTNKDGEIYGICGVSTDITDHKSVEAALRERIKELRCLYGISHLIESEKTLSEIIQGIADLVPDSWQYPPITSCRIVVEGNDIRSNNHCEASCNKCLHAFLSQPIVVKGNISGEIRVCYKEERPEADEGPFLREERDLINAIAERIGRIAERNKTEEALRKSEEKYRLISENMADIVTTMDMDLNFTYVSPSIMKLRGFTVEEALEQKIDQIMTPDSFQRLSTIFAEELSIEQTGKADLDRVRSIELEEYKKDGSTIWVENSVSFIRDSYQKPVGILSISRDITERKKTEDKLKKIEWLLEKERSDSQKSAKNYIPDYGDVTKLNTERKILDNVGAETLKKLCSDIMDLLDTSIAVYERNGDYAFGQFDSTWCQTMDSASFRLCKTQDNKEALNCGKWLCHENCWNDSAKEVIKSQKTTDIECIGGIHLYAVPIYAEKNLIGVINMGYGNPPTDERTLKELAEKFHVEYEVLIENATKYKARPHFIIENAKQRLHTIAQLIGQIVDSAQKEKELRKAKEKIEKSEERFSLAMEVSKDGIWDWDVTTGELYCSPGLTAMLGYDSTGVIEHIDTWKDLIHPEDRQKVYQANLNCVNNLINSFENEYRLKSRDGGWKWILGRGQAVSRDVSGRALRIIGTHQNITDRKQAEDTLRKSHERFLTVLNSIDATIHVVDMQSHEILFMNKYMIDSFGSDFTGEACWKALRGESEKCSYCHNDQLIDDNGKPTGVYTWQDQNPITGKWYINYDRAIDWMDGRLVKIQIATDITEMKQMEEQLRQAHKMESIGTLAGGIAHEFNNMLGIIIGNIELAVDDIPDWNPARDSLNEIKTASLRAKEVVRKLLSVARKTPESRKPIPIGSIVKESLDLMRRTIPTTIDIRRKIACSTEMILGDTTEINQIVINLCTNSVHAMTEKNSILEVSLDTKQLNRESARHYEDLEPGDYVRLTVRDTGEGIEPAFMDRLFDPYFTTKDVDQGLGMGLAVVHGIVKKHDGAIKIKSEVGKGTTVEVLFPLIEEQAETRSEDVETPQRGTERVLLVDDEPSIVKMVTQMLKRSGYEVIGKTSSSNALKAFKKAPEKFDLVISDMAMPEMAGDQLAIEIKQIRPEIPFILCTGHSDRMDENRAIKLGIEAFITKPFSRKDITETIPKALDKTKGTAKG